MHMGMFSSSFFKLLAMFVQSGSKPKQKGWLSSCHFMLWHPELATRGVQVAHTEVSALNWSCVARSVGVLTLALPIFLSVLRKCRATARGFYDRRCLTTTRKSRKAPKSTRSISVIEWLVSIRVIWSRSGFWWGPIGEGRHSSELFSGSVSHCIAVINK